MLGRVTVGLFFLLLVWGNVVAGLKAGLACPDWPLCHGKILPPYRIDIYMEFLHRVIAAAATVFLGILSYRRFRAYRGGARAVPVAAAALILLEIGLGGAVVLRGIPVELTTVHFIIGLAVFLLVNYMTAFDGITKPPVFPATGVPALFFGVTVLVFALAALGAYVRHSHAGLACPDWPTCLGGLLPAALTPHVLIHFSHRVLAALVFLTVTALYAAAALDPRLARHRSMARSLFFLIAVQVGIGGLVVLTGLNFLSAAVHLAVALAMLSVLTHMWVAEVRADAPEAP